MFKKKSDFAISSRALLKKKDVKKVKEYMLKSFRKYGNFTEEQLDEILPTKAPLEQIKLSNRCLIYVLAESSLPICFDMNGRGNIVPTVFLLWRYPDLLPAVTTYGPVSKKVVRGADLMLPGIILEQSALQDISEGDLRCIKVLGNPLPFAVGTSGVSSRSLQENGARSGRGVNVLHCFLDELWRFAADSLKESVQKHGLNEDETKRELFGNEGFSAGGFVTECGQQACTEAERMSESGGENEEEGQEESVIGNEKTNEGRETAIDGQDEQEILHGGVSSTTTRISAEVESADDPICTGLTSLCVEQDAVNVARATGAKAASGAAETNSQEVAVTKEEMDQLLLSSCLQALKTALRPKELPILVSQFYAGKMLPSRPAGTRLDIKRSSYKKVGPFFAYLKQQGVIQLDDKSGNLWICGVNKQHPLLREHRLHEAAESVGAVDGPQQSSGAAKRKAGKFEVVELYRPKTEAMKQVLGLAFVPAKESFPSLTSSTARNTGGAGPSDKSEQELQTNTSNDPSSSSSSSSSSTLPPPPPPPQSFPLYTAREFRDTLFYYVQRQNLSRRQFVELDALLCRAVMPKSDKIGAEILQLEKAQILQMGLAAMENWFGIRELGSTTNSGSASDSGSADWLAKPCKGRPPVVTLVGEKKRNKVITQVENVEAYGLSPDTLAGIAQKKFACSTTVQPSIMTSGRMTVVIQGLRVEDMAEYMIETCGIPKNYIKKVYRSGLVKKK